MPLSVTHVILTIIVVDLFRDYIMKNHQRYITLHTLLIAGVGIVGTIVAGVLIYTLYIRRKREKIHSGGEQQ